MTVYLWDASNYDWPRAADHTLNFAAVRKDGISGVTHKATEGHTYTDAYFARAMATVRPVGFALLGSYHVLWPDDTQQTDHWFDTVTVAAPWWKDHPCFVWQIDAEAFSYMPRRPSLAEIHACGARLQQLGVAAEAIVVYAPKWLYGDTLTGLRYKLWSSAYGPNPVEDYQQAYPGDNGSGWQPYSGIIPSVWQYGSQTLIGDQSTCDASAVRVASESALQALFTGGDMPLTSTEIDAVAKAVWGYGLVNPSTGVKQSASTRIFQLGDHETADHDDLVRRLTALSSLLNPTNFAAALAPILAPLLPPGVDIPQAELEAALRDVLGSLNDPPPAPAPAP